MSFVNEWHPEANFCIGWYKSNMNKLLSACPHKLSKTNSCFSYLDVESSIKLLLFAEFKVEGHTRHDIYLTKCTHE